MNFIQPIISSVSTSITYLAVNQPKNLLVRWAANTARTIYLTNVIFGLYAGVQLANSLVKSNNLYEKLINKTVVVLLVGGLSLIPGMGFCATIYVHGNSIIHKIEKWQRDLLR